MVPRCGGGASLRRRCRCRVVSWAPSGFGRSQPAGYEASSGRSAKARPGVRPRLTRAFDKGSPGVRVTAGKRGPSLAAVQCARSVPVASRSVGTALRDVRCTPWCPRRPKAKLLSALRGVSAGPESAPGLRWLGAWLPRKCPAKRATHASRAMTPAGALPDPAGVRRASAGGRRWTETTSGAAGTRRAPRSPPGARASSSRRSLRSPTANAPQRFAACIGRV